MRPQICLSLQPETFPYGNITFHNYHGKTDSYAVLSIPASSILKYPSLSLRTRGSFDIKWHQNFRRKSRKEKKKGINYLDKAFKTI